MINRTEIMDFRNYLTTRFLYRYKILNIFLIVIYSGLIVLFIASLILTLNYKYNLKIDNQDKHKIFLGLVIFAGISLLASTFFVIHAVIFAVVGNYVILKTNNYKYLKENKKINYASFAYTFYFYNKKRTNNKNSKNFYSTINNFIQMGDLNGHS